MIIVKMNGGLGNQLFQYAYGRSVSSKKNTELKLDTSGYYKKEYLAIQNDTKRTFLLDVFNIKASIASEAEVQKFNPFLFKVSKKVRNKIIGFKNPYKFDEKEFNVSKDSYREGFWQSEKYFADIKEEIQNELIIKIPFGEPATKIKEKITSVQASGGAAVSMHIRRSDYVNIKVNAEHFAVCDKAYYERAFDEIVRSAHGKSLELFIFSDDIAWAKENLSFPCPMNFVSDGIIKEYEELCLMSICNHHIIANSTFSWWGAWLNPSSQKIVIAPKRWLQDKTVDTHDIMPKEWIIV